MLELAAVAIALIAPFGTFSSKVTDPPGYNAIPEFNTAVLSNAKKTMFTEVFVIASAVRFGFADKTDVDDVPTLTDVGVLPVIGAPVFIEIKISSIS